MGTRALIKPINEYGETICTIYLQFDGYPDGLPLLVARYLASRKLVNGIPFGGYFKVVNTMADLTAQVIALLKSEVSKNISEFLKSKADGFVAGTVYVEPPDVENVWEEYVYYIYPDPEFSELMRKGRELYNKVEKLMNEGKEDEAKEVRKLIGEIERRFFGRTWNIHIKACKVTTDKSGKRKEEVLYDGTVQGYVRKFSKENPK